jgi:hypothetical protein
MKTPKTAIEGAFAAGEFGRAERLWTEYARRLRGDLASGAAGAAELAEAGELLVWARTVVKCFRAHASTRIEGARVAAAYAGPDPAKSQKRARAVL